MKEISPAELRAMMVDLLTDIHQYCETNNLRYYMAFGTLLGAVRHKGFIPWDDDIDIWMPRPDYDRFLKEYKSDHFAAIWAGNYPGYPLDFAKVHDTRTLLVEEGGDGNWGVFVDVFPLDGAHDEKSWRQTLKRVALVRHLVANQRFTRNLAFSKKAGLKKNLSILAGKITHPFLSMKKLLLWEDRIMKKNAFADCDHVCDYTDLTAQFFEKEIFAESVPLEFEGRRFLAPVLYDKCLTMLFGDYMTPPPPEKQVSYHGSKAYWKTPTNYTVQRFEDSNLEAEDLVHLLHAAFQEREEQGLHFSIASIDVVSVNRIINNCSVFVAIKDYKPIGMETLRLCAEPSGKMCGNLGGVAVLPEWNHLGVASSIFKVLLQQARDARCDHLFSDTAEHALSSVKWHRKMGFKIVGYGSSTRTNYYSYIFRMQLEKNMFWSNPILPVFVFIYQYIKTHITKKKSGEYRPLFQFLLRK